LAFHHQPGGNPGPTTERQEPVESGLPRWQAPLLLPAYVVEPKNGLLSRALLALHLTREAHVQDALHQVAIEYHLTDREQEALVGISMGLTSKELADQMGISPNTVKAFTRLIMLKMGVTTRTGILGKVLEQNGRQNETLSA
jgi:DNA-binding CsgD family transcriptional regulator